jgi:hypothetical protein
MNVYHFYELDELEHPIGRHTLECADDLDALEKAQKLSTEYAIEIWSTDRRVARVKKHDAPLVTSDRASL